MMSVRGEEKMTYATYEREQARDRIARKHPVNYLVRVPYAWPGGYAVYGVTDDGDIVCSSCARDKYAQYRRAERGDSDRGWKLTLQTTQGDEHFLACDDCGRVLSGCWRDPENGGDGVACEEGCPFGLEYQP